MIKECLKAIAKLFIVLCLIMTYVSVKKEQDPIKRYAEHVRAFQHPQVLKTYCTGFNVMLDGKPYVISNQHCCAAANMYSAENTALLNLEFLQILAVDSKHDLCIIRGNHEKGLEIATEDVKHLDKITLIGHPRGLNMTVREGRIIEEDKKVCVFYGPKEGVKCRKSDQISATAYGGNSGSPVLNEKGEVVGVLYAGSNAYPHEPFIVPWEALTDFIKRFKESNL